MTFLLTALSWLRSGIVSAAQWLWERPVALAGAVGFAVGAILLWWSKSNEIASLQVAAEVQRLRAERAALEKEAQLLVKQGKDLEPRAQKLKEEDAELKRQIAALAKPSVDLTTATDADVARQLTEMGL